MTKLHAYRRGVLVGAGTLFMIQAGADYADASGQTLIVIIPIVAMWLALSYFEPKDKQDEKES